MQVGAVVGLAVLVALLAAVLALYFFSRRKATKWEERARQAGWKPSSRRSNGRDGSRSRSRSSGDSTSRRESDFDEENPRTEASGSEQGEDDGAAAAAPAVPPSNAAASKAGGGGGSRRNSAAPASNNGKAHQNQNQVAAAKENHNKLTYARLLDKMGRKADASAAAAAAPAPAPLQPAASAAAATATPGDKLGEPVSTSPDVWLKKVKTPDDEELQKAASPPPRHPSSVPAEAPLAEGDFVELHSLRVRTELNGLQGFVAGTPDGGGGVAVQIHLPHTQQSPGGKKTKKMRLNVANLNLLRRSPSPARDTAAAAAADAATVPPATLQETAAPSPDRPSPPRTPQQKSTATRSPSPDNMVQATTPGTSVAATSPPRPAAAAGTTNVPTTPRQTIMPPSPVAVPLTGGKTTRLILPLDDPRGLYSPPSPSRVESSVVSPIPAPAALHDDAVVGATDKFFLDTLLQRAKVAGEQDESVDASGIHAGDLSSVGGLPAAAPPAGAGDAKIPYGHLSGHQSTYVLESPPRRSSPSRVGPREVTPATVLKRGLVHTVFDEPPQR